MNSKLVPYGRFEGQLCAASDYWMALFLELIMNRLQVRMDPRNKTKDDFKFGSVTDLTPEEFYKQEAGYLYRYRYNGGAASQVWLSHGRCGNSIKE